MVNAQEYLNQNYPCNCNEKDQYDRLIHQENCPRKDLKELNLRNLNLEGDLDLSDCPNLIELNCSNNELKNLDFLKTLLNLEKLSIQNNPNLASNNLEILSKFIGLKELDISNCGKSLKGSLKSLENMKDLKKEVDAFLKEFDEDNNGEIDVNELKEKRKQLFRPQSMDMGIPQTQAHEYVIPIEEQFYEQFAHSQQGGVSSLWSSLPWNKSQKPARTINKDKSSESFEVNRSLNSSSVNLLNKSKQKEVIIEMQNLETDQQAQIIQQEPFGTPGSSK